MYYLYIYMYVYTYAYVYTHDNMNLLTVLALARDLAAPEEIGQETVPLAANLAARSAWNFVSVQDQNHGP